MAALMNDMLRDTLDRLAALIAERCPPADAPLMQRYARLYFATSPAEDLQRVPLEDLYGAALSHWRLAQGRAPGVPAIRIYNPDHETHGWRSTHSVVDVVTEDMPFLVDSLGTELVRHGHTIHCVLHPVIKVIRDEHRHITDVAPRDADASGAEAFMRFEVDRQPEEKSLCALRDDLLRVLGEVRAVVEDWPRMQQRLHEVIGALRSCTAVSAEERDEAIAFLRWLDDHHFTFIGFRSYDLVTENGEDQLRTAPHSGLGIYRGEATYSHSFAAMPPERRALAHSAPLLITTKSTAKSTVHRPAHLDYVGIRRYSASGEVCGEWRFLGLYSSAAYSTRPGDIPLLRRKLQHVLERAGFPPASHDGKALQHILDTYPRDELFHTDAEELYEITTGILRIQERHKLSLFMHPDPYGRFMSALVYVPKDRYSTELRLRMQAILVDACQGLSSEFDVMFTESVLARVHFVIRTQPEKKLNLDLHQLEARLARALLTWQDELQNAAVEQCGEAQGLRLAQRYMHAFPPAYRDGHSPRTAIADLLRLEELEGKDDYDLHLYRPLEDAEERLRLKVYSATPPAALSDALPVFERMGLRVLAAHAFEIDTPGNRPYWIVDYVLEAPQPVDLQAVRPRFEEAYSRIYAGAMESDGFNRLIVTAGLGWRDIMLLRAISKYLLQIRLPFSQSYMESCLASNAGLARRIVDFFHARFDPAAGERDERVNACAADIEHALESIASLDEDRILRQFYALVKAMLRTNFFQRGADGELRHEMAFKLDPAELPGMPEPRPKFEIFVYSPRFEGVHLRGGRVARGGLRWSDRREDFRTEVLGLMKAQMVKNTVIVPVGAKGGFVPKRPPAAREEFLAVGKECYRAFVGALLDLTDNAVNGGVDPPAEVVRYDTDDPYLVVAADKGTATFSDLANAISLERGFWLGDAFASGGSTGYDHKKMGITARGAWESVKRHFRELGTDIQTKPFTVVGIGGMSGDVFGNGMLQSRAIKLIAAFNHNQIFIDPDPEPARSFEERLRLFKLPRSSWQDYDPALISAGGGVYSRAAKVITLSEQARAALGISEEKLSPNELVQALLRAPVDLLWNGGIGTYVKASSESHVDVGDKSNDSVRVDAVELRCRVVGEGGNLGFTQRARTEYARRGGKINTDAIDNSGGVDCSDHEVNIKILLDKAVRAGDLTQKQRNELLAAMTDEVAALVISDNYLQTQALSIAVHHAPLLLSEHARLIRSLEREGRLQRRLEFLPSDEEFTQLEAAGLGLTRPELAVVLAYAKIKLYQELISSDVAEDPFLGLELENYFPTPLRARFRDRMQEHPLKREIICTQVTSSLINRMGSTFCMRVQSETGEPAAMVARAYAAAREIFDVPAIWQAIEALDNEIEVNTQLEMITATRRLLDRATLWLLRKRYRPLDIAATVRRYQCGVRMLAARLPRVLDAQGKRLFRQESRRLVAAGAPRALALRIAGLEPLYAALDLTDVAEQRHSPLLHAAASYFNLMEALEIYWLHACIDALPRASSWQRKARTDLVDDLYTNLRRLLANVLRSENHDGGKPQAQHWLELNRTAVEHVRGVYTEIKAAKTLDHTMFAVAARGISRLAQAEE